MLVKFQPIHCEDEIFSGAIIAGTSGGNLAIFIPKSDVPATNMPWSIQPAMRVGLKVKNLVKLSHFLITG